MYPQAHSQSSLIKLCLFCNSQKRCFQAYLLVWCMQFQCLHPPLYRWQWPPYRDLLVRACPTQTWNGQWNVCWVENLDLSRETKQSLKQFFLLKYVRGTDRSWTHLKVERETSELLNLTEVENEEEECGLRAIEFLGEAQSFLPAESSPFVH